MGRFIVADPKICHGSPTFRGTRVLVADVLEQVAVADDDGAATVCDATPLPQKP